MNLPTEDEVFDRAKQLFEEENGRPWKGEDDAVKYIERARIELSAIEEEGHS